MKTLSILILFTTSFSLLGDTIYLSNNNSVKGTILLMNEELIKIETANGVLEINKDKIVRGEFFGEGNEISGDLILEFLFNGLIKDSSGNGYPVKTMSIPYVTGFNNEKKSAIKSLGNGEYFYIENGKNISNIDNFTVAFYFKPEDTTSNSFLVSNWENTFSDGKAEGRFSLSVLNDNLMFFVVDSKGYYQSLGAKNVLTNKEWNTVAFRFNNGEMSLFVNGITVGKNSISENTLLKGEWPIYFLTAKNGKDFKKYNIIGSIDNIKMFDNFLSDKELNLLYKSKK